VPVGAHVRADRLCLQTMTSSADNPRARPGDPLTPREREILALVAAGEPTTAIAGRLSISENTVKGHLTHVYAKTGSRNRVQATRYHLDHHTPVAADSSRRN
jgi:DNA-binding CsgD family transcriptional regulator